MPFTSTSLDIDGAPQLHRFLLNSERDEQIDRGVEYATQAGTDSEHGPFLTWSEEARIQRVMLMLRSPIRPLYVFKAKTNSDSWDLHWTKCITMYIRNIASAIRVQLVFFSAPDYYQCVGTERRSKDYVAETRLKLHPLSSPLRPFT